MDNNRFTESKKYIEEMCKAIDIEKPERLEILTRDQLEVIFEGLLTGIDSIDFFIENNKFDANQMNEILDGFRFDIDAASYCNTDYDWKQMKIIKTMLFRGYSKEQIEELGFYNPEMDWSEMNVISYEIFNSAS